MLIIPRRKAVITDPYFANVALLLQPVAGGSIVDLSPSPKTLTVSGNTQVSSSPGYPAILFDGSGDYITVGNSNSFDTNQAFTYELFFQRTSGNAMFFYRGGGADGWSGSNTIQSIIYISGSTLYAQFNPGPISITTTAPSTGALHYLSVSYNGTTIEAHLNGVRISSTLAVLAVPATRNIIEIGSYGINRGTFDLNGYISAMRWTTGVARNTGATIPVPSLPLPTS
jgi:hypothetical protein